MKSKEAECIDIQKLDTDFANEIAALPGGENIRKCFACGTCTAGCPVAAVEPAYSPRRIIRQVLLGMKEEVLKSPEIWYCLVCYRCYARCPQQVNFTDVMAVLRYLAVKQGFARGELLQASDEVERLSQTLRRDLVKEVLDGKKQMLNEMQARAGKDS